MIKLFPGTSGPARQGPVRGTPSLENTVDLGISNSRAFSLALDQYKAYQQSLVEDRDI